MKRCTQCRMLKPVSAFRKYSGASSDGLRPLCRDCQRKYEQFWRCANKKRLAEARQKRRDKDTVYRQRYIESNKALYLVSRIKSRCRKKSIPFDLDKHLSEISDRIQAGRCEISGFPLKMKHGGWMTYNSPSIDRKDPSAGYVYNNIRIVCFAMNAALGNWGEEKLRAVIHGWLGKK